MASLRTTSNKLMSLIKVASGGTLLFGGICLYRGNEQFYDTVAMPLVQLINPEVAHRIGVTALKWGLTPTQRVNDPASLEVKTLGLKFSNPIGMAAGFDKQGEAVNGLIKMGFSFVEIGSITPIPQSGNPKPRVFRLTDDNAIINRYGFNSEGHEVVYNRLKSLRSKKNFSGIIGVNLGKNKLSEDPTKDYTDGIKKFSDIADYFVINISSPNTPGLRDLQNKKSLSELLSSINETRATLSTKPPLLLKLAPDLTETQRQDVAEVIMDSKTRVDGLILSNTTVSRENLSHPLKNETGGLSGAPLADSSTKMIEDMYLRTHGKIPIIGVGGIFSGADAYAKIKAGASLLQIYTSYAYHGPPIVQKIKNELDELIAKDGYTSIEEAVGKNTKSK